jgi:hypothetical protein
MDNMTDIGEILVLVSLTSLCLTGSFMFLVMAIAIIRDRF